MIVTVRWIVAIAFLLISLSIVVGNWGIFVNNYILRKQWSSAIPFLGGIVGAVGVALLPIAGIWKFAWLPLVLDWGSIPVVVVSLFLAARRPPDP